MRECPCSTKHVPKPVFLVHESGHLMCPTSAVNLKQLLMDYKKYNGAPPGSVTKHYSAYVRGLARDMVGVLE